MDQEHIETRTVFRGELTELRDTVLNMGAFVANMLSSAVRALVEQDRELAEEVRRSDETADILDLKIEEAAMRLLALQQPLARDLRAIAASLRIVADLERVGDYAKDIAKVARRLSSEAYFKPLEDIPRMAREVGDMLQDALRCFADRNLELARRVAGRDKSVDALWDSLREELIVHMQQRPEVIRQAVHLLLVARYLERIGDHTVNVVERVNYMETGRLEALA